MLQTGGAILAYFFGEDFLADIAGINLIGGYAELRNEYWRFLFGRAGDLINPRRPGTIDFNSGRNAGNLGFTRGQFRVERFLHPNHNTQVTTQFSLSNPIATAYNGNLANNPLNSTVLPGLPTRNVFVFGNLVWDTDYAPLPAQGDNAPGDNEAMIYRTRVVFRF